MPFAPVNGIQLYYETHGEGTPIVFAHGRGGNHLSWWQQVAEFQTDYRCITFDHRGWGQSRAEFGSPLRPNFAADLAALLDYLEVGPALLVAQSMGGVTCLEFALAQPRRVLGLLMGDTTGGVAAPAVHQALAQAHPPEGLTRSLAPEFIRQQSALTMLYQQIGALNPERGEDGVMAGFRRPDGPQAADFAGWQTPTLLVVGDQDGIFPPEVIAEVQRVIPGSQMEVVAGAAHSAHFEQAAVFNALLSEFLSGILAGQPAAVAAD